MWARAKGAAENELMRLFPKTYSFRPALIQPLHGIQSRTKLYRIMYSITRPILPLLVRMFPKHATTTDQIGLALVHVGKRGWGKKILEARDINEVPR
jgi:hypothetical protein